MLSDESRILAGILLLALVTVETGGLYLVKLVRGKAPPRRSSSRSPAPVTRTPPSC